MKTAFALLLLCVTSTEQGPTECFVNEFLKGEKTNELDSNSKQSGDLCGWEIQFDSRKCSNPVATAKVVSAAATAVTTGCSYADNGPPFILQCVCGGSECNSNLDSLYTMVRSRYESLMDFKQTRESDIVICSLNALRKAYGIGNANDKPPAPGSEAQNKWLEDTKNDKIKDYHLYYTTPTPPKTTTRTTRSPPSTSSEGTTSSSSRDSQAPTASSTAAPKIGEPGYFAKYGEEFRHITLTPTKPSAASRVDWRALPRKLKLPRIEVVQVSKKYDFWGTWLWPISQYVCCLFLLVVIIVYYKYRNRIIEEKKEIRQRTINMGLSQIKLSGPVVLPTVQKEKVEGKLLTAMTTAREARKYIPVRTKIWDDSDYKGEGW